MTRSPAYLIDVFKFGGSNPYQTESKSRKNLDQKTSFLASEVVTDGDGNITEMPLLKRKPCFGRPERFIRGTACAGQTVWIRGTGRIVGAPNQCEKCPVIDACGKVSVERIECDPAIEQALDAWRAASDGSVGKAKFRSSVKWVDCDLAHLQATTKIKGGDVVKRPLTRALAATIEKQDRSTPFVFTFVCQKTRGDRRKGVRYPLTPTALRKPWAAALKAAEIESFRIHDLRHTLGTRIVRQTGSLAAAKSALHHSNISTTLRYAHVTDDDLRKTLETVASRNSPKP